MRIKLSAANVYLRDPVLRARTVLKSVASSSAIEGIRAPFRRIGKKRGSTVAQRAASVRRGRLARAKS